MRFKLFAVSGAILVLGLSSAHASDVNVGVTVAGEISPGVYGRVNIGNTPPPVVYQQPVVIVRQPRPVAPIYMNVPPGHAKKWSKHCHKYNACAQPVYFVKSAEYGGHDRGRGGRSGRDDGHGRGHHDDHHGHGHGHKEKKHKHHHD
ncbi:hypothetical protein ACFQUU_10795 [Herbaspirillum sp. GCM10030257]|uniref:hypothetical protein n=1 Tax=Herbaspirillum sp. GCM10030257 TaxID=3273393 RepID=UPI0036087441